MVSCEKCWRDAHRRQGLNPAKSVSEHYKDLLDERKDSPCSPQEQAGEYWDEDQQQDTRLPTEVNDD